MKKAGERNVPRPHPFVFGDWCELTERFGASDEVLAAMLESRDSSGTRSQVALTDLAHQRPASQTNTGLGEIHFPQSCYAYDHLGSTIPSGMVT